ncbi:hemolysin family protein [Lentilactobacillus kefiri]|uniref:hemolysin family protein n=1 Tax=Lentilactobacillus kefiri TaxID=33962 RepID=UPI0006D0076B|nr:hemolysin family protein [Lentilactobacillus kefiri]MCP9369097.1 HlyC/CorC family transporter [Lentilactobacillus kefiri]MDH5108394.1 hemolysin family protein [Lentilactobacillus kefiri]MDM7492768.1 hemolysin family protein [Lentilactobacillus kefiri]UOD78475.1 hemolysin family protein [Lentilactobacillus kefiri]
MRNRILDDSQILTNLIIVIVTFFFAAFFVASEFALVQTRPSALDERKKKLIETKGKQAKGIKKLNRQLHMVTNLNEYLSTTQVGVSLAGIILGYLGESFVVTILVDIMEIHNSPIDPTAAHAVGAVVGIILLTYLEVVLTEIVPKNISIDMPMQVLSFISTPLHYFHVIFYPFVWLLNISANGIVKMMGLKVANENDESFSQAEILSLSRNAVKSGALEQNDYLYMQRAFQLNDKVAKDIMIDRTQLIVIDIKTTVKQAVQVYLQKKFSRIPVVANGDKDKILGYVYNYDLIRQSQVDPTIKIDRLLRDISTTPEMTPITDVLHQMIKKRTPIVVVVDEYGGTSGIITDKDIYEELFGTVRDEIDPSITDYIFKQPNGSYQVNGKLTTHDFERYFDADFPEFTNSDAVTLAGYFLDNYPDIKAGDVIAFENFDFKIIDYENSFINWFEVTKHKPRTDGDTDDNEKD